MLGIRTADPKPPKQIRLVWARIHAAGVVEHLADFDAATDKLLTRRRNVGDDQVQSLCRTRCRPGDVLAEDDRASRTGRSELNHAEVATVVVVGIKPPSKPYVELLRPVHIRDGNNDDLKLRVDLRDAGPIGTAHCIRQSCHVLSPIRSSKLKSDFCCMAQKSLHYLATPALESSSRPSHLCTAHCPCKFLSSS